MAAKENRYSRLIEHVFFEHHEPGAISVEFRRSDLAEAARTLGIPLPKNLGDIIYSFRYRSTFPNSIREIAPEGQQWIIRPAGKAKYRFELASASRITPSPRLLEARILDSTPGIIDRYALSDEQALLAKLRYNRLIDIFTGLTCYHLQSHLRTHIPDIGQVEADDLYVGVDRHGAHYVIPVEAKGGTDALGVVQIEQDFSLCRAKFPALAVRPVAAQFLRDDAIAMFEFALDHDEVAIALEKHYRLVSPEDLSEEELASYLRPPID